MNKIKFNIRKPLYGNYVYLRGSMVEKAIRLGLQLEIKIPNGKAVMDPKKWKETGKMMKKVFKYKETPMILYGNWVNIPAPAIKAIEEKPKKKKEKNKQLGLL